MSDTVSDPEAQRRYQLDRPVGSGGFGDVYLGRLLGRSGFTKIVAIKVLNGKLARHPEIEQRLRDEARLLGLLRHRAIVQVEDLVEIGGCWAIIMEFIEGEDLGALLTRGPLPPRVACGIAQEVASALKAAHTARDRQTGEPLEIVHRDIKPANLRITPAGEVKVLDFGIARSRFDAREAHTRDLSFGSTGYMAPERLDGIDTPPSDVYALGAVLSESLTGKRLGQLSIHPAQHAEALFTLRASLGDAPPALVDLLLRMLAYERGQRPSADDVERSLRELLVELPGPWLQDWAPAVITRAAPLSTLPPSPRSPSMATRAVDVAPTLAPAPPTARLAAPPAIPASVDTTALELLPPPPSPAQRGHADRTNEDAVFDEDVFDEVVFDDAMFDDVMFEDPVFQDVAFQDNVFAEPDHAPGFDDLGFDDLPPGGMARPPIRSLLPFAIGGAAALLLLLAGVGALAVVGLWLDDTSTAQSSGATNDATADAESSEQRSGGKKRSDGRRKGGSGR